MGKNVNDLKIFGGVGRVSVIQTENFSQHEVRWLFFWGPIRGGREGGTKFQSERPGPIFLMGFLGGTGICSLETLKGHQKAKQMIEVIGISAESVSHKVQAWTRIKRTMGKKAKALFYR